MQLRKDLLNFGRMIQSEVGIDAQIFGNAALEIVPDALVGLIILTGELTTELDD